MISHIDAMQAAVDIVNKSPHPTSKVAAALYCKGALIANFNHPAPILEKYFPVEERFGGASSYLHAETACLLQSQNSLGGSIYVTDPFCPNCAKNMAEAGIKNIFIDHKGFAKDFAKRRGSDFENMSMKICNAAGINVYELHRKDSWIIPILVHPADYIAKQDNPVEITDSDIKGLNEFKAYVKALLEIREFDESFAIGYGEGKVLIAQRHLSIGYREEKAGESILHPEGKYSFWIEPANRLLMTAKRSGIDLNKDMFCLSQHPSARELVNMVGANITSPIILDMQTSRDENGPKAYEKLKGRGILTFQSLD